MRFLFKTRYQQDLALIEHGGQRFWYGLLLAALAAAPWVLPAYLVSQLVFVLIYGKVRRFIGVNRMQWAITGAAPISPELIRWYRAIGVTLVEGYGMTESTGGATLNVPGANRIGSVGRAQPFNEIALSPDGEILMRGDNVFLGTSTCRTRPPSKGACINFTRALAGEWGRYGITVNAIAPGVFPTKTAKGLLVGEGQAARIASAPLKRIGDDEDLKGLTALFASDAGKHITGQVVAVDGGVSAIIAA